MTERWQRLSSLLDELFDLEPASRAARLAQIETEDDALGAELRRALAADERSGVLDHGVASAAATMMDRLVGERGDATPAGSRVGPYRLLERVGSGGMGEVWRGERIDADFQQEVAIKLIRPMLDSPALRERFARERRILARLDHPNIARLLDGGVAADGTPWYAMEFVRGRQITQFAREHALDARARVELVLQAGDAVAHAQALLVVHRDIKPSNMLVDAHGRVRVLDFGIARMLDDSAENALTGTGIRLFSPAYAAPEQIRGDAVGTAADVFCLGAVLYELLTGELPHPRRGAAPERLLAGLPDEGAPRPGRTLRERSASGHDARDGIPPLRELDAELDLIVATALQPDPARRYRGAAQFADDLRRWLDGRPIAAQADTAGYRMRKFVLRHRVAVGSAVAVLLALVAGLAVALWQADVAREHAARADAEADRAARQARRANAEAARAEREAAAQKAQVARTRKVKEFLVSIFLQADPRRASSEGPPDMARAFDAALERARSELADDPVLQADVFDDFGEIRAGQGRFDEAQTLFEQALAVAEKEYGVDHPVVAESLVNLGVLMDYRDRTLEGAPYIERAVAILERDDGGEPTALANALSALGSLRQMQGRLDEARALTRRTLDISRRHRAADDLTLAVHITNQATVDANAQRIDEAATGFDEAIGMFEKVQGPQSPNLFPNLVAVAQLYYAQGRFDLERRTYRRALDIARSNFQGDHPWIASGLVEAGYTTARDEDALRGETMIREGIGMFERLHSPRVITGLRRLGLSQSRRGESSAALQTLERAISICEAAGQADEQICVVTGVNRAQVLADAGRTSEALVAAETGLARVERLAAKDGLASERAQAMEAIATALTALGREKEASAHIDGAIALLRDAFGDEHAETKAARALKQRLLAPTPTR